MGCEFTKSHSDNLDFSSREGEGFPPSAKETLKVLIFRLSVFNFCGTYTAAPVCRTMSGEKSFQLCTFFENSNGFTPILAPPVPSTMLRECSDPYLADLASSPSPIDGLEGFETRAIQTESKLQAAFGLDGLATRYIYQLLHDGFDGRGLAGRLTRDWSPISPNEL